MKLANMSCNLFGGGQAFLSPMIRSQSFVMFYIPSLRHSQVLFSFLPPLQP